MNSSVGVVSVILILCTVYFTASKGGIAETVYTATLSPNQVVGAYISGNNERSAGVAVCHISRYSQPPSITCNIEHNLDELTSAGLFFGASGTTGTELKEIDIRSGGHLQVSFNISSAEMMESTLDGQLYIQLSTTDYPDGELRGQIEHRDRFYAELSSRNTVPRSSGTDATGYAVGTYSERTRVLDFDLVHSVTLGTATEIRSGSPGTAGTLKESFLGTSPLFQLAPLTREEDNDLLSELLFLNVNSETNPQGDIRGQLISIDYINTGAFSAILNGENSGNSSPASGLAITTFNCDTLNMEYLVIHNVDEATAGFVYIDSEEQNSLLFSLPSGSSPIYGNVLLLPGEAEALYDGELNFAIQSNNGDGIRGEISGVIDATRPLFAYLSGTNVVPPVATHYVGLLIGEISDTNMFSYEIIHNVVDAVEIIVLVGPEGENSKQEAFELPTLRSPGVGSIEIDNNDIVDAIIAGGAYLEIRTRSKPFGVIRGTISTLDACKLEFDNNVSAYEDSFGTLRSSDTSVLSYLSYIDKDDDEFDVYVRVIDAASTNVPALLLSVLLLISFFL